MPFSVAAAAIGAGTALFSASQKGSGGSTSSATSNAPWGPQQNYLTQGYQQAQDIYNQNMAVGPFTGEQTAGPNGYQTSAEQAAAGYAGGAGVGLPGEAAGAASTLMGAASPFVSNAGNIASNGIAGPNAGLAGTLQGFGTGANTIQGPSSGLSSALNTSAINGANAMGTFQNGLSTAANKASSDPTAQIASDASIYANNPGVRASIAATNNQINQTLNEQTVPGLNREASMGGSLNSSRAGMAEGMANQGAATAEGTADASILNNAYNTGMNTAGNLYATGLNTSVNANLGGYNASAAAAQGVGAQQQQLGEANASNELGAANSGLASNLAYEQGNANTQLAGNAQLGTATGLGFGGVGTAGNAAATNAGLYAGAGNLQQSGQQAVDTNALQGWQMQTGYPQQLENSYMGNINGNVGSSSTGSTTSTLPPNVAGSALGGAAAGYGLYQNATGSSTPGGSTIGNWFNNTFNGGNAGNAYTPSIYGVPSPY